MSYTAKFGDQGIYVFGESAKQFYICIDPDAVLWDIDSEKFKIELSSALRDARIYHKAEMMREYFSAYNYEINYIIRGCSADQLKEYLDNSFASEDDKKFAIKVLTFIDQQETKRKRKRAADMKLRMRVLVRDNFLCRYCGRKVEPNTPLDHVIPYSLGGLTEDNNLVVSCKPCNSKKAGKTLAESGMILLLTKGNDL